ncbi:hypothetical protein [Thermoflavimicrobium daqui]|jgi:hypothetical protein|uniref:Uncharacterized protein n=1 Tax=Thermoflavimicrobium daqui TaxID=2137476 RepID=A0A364K0E9_9BACL|nr:hypothetical protein [Thermoflavimicrobium daqui]RAL20824.1 hypothetical protein DL897_17650 [Thermoflavimicrobium daqui]
MTDEQAFFLGIKPALLANEMYERFDELLTFPHVTDFSPIRYSCTRRMNYKGWLFFQTEEQKQEVLKKAEELGITSIDDIEAERLLGHILGYPPKAVDTYLQRLKLKQENQAERKRKEIREVAMEYYGCVFMCYVEDILECAKWLWDTYPFSELDQLLIDHCGEKAKVEFRDFNGLNHLIDHLETKIYVESQELLHT